MNDQNPGELGTNRNNIPRWDDLNPPSYSLGLYNIRIGKY